MSTATLETSTLVSDLEALAAEDNWAFRSWASREYSHGFFQYPAMMVPQMQRELLARLADENGATHVYDPFVGSGTTMAEAMLLGLDFAGSDINPLAVLLCRAKAGPFFLGALAAAGQRVVEGALADRSRKIAVDWAGWEKWFRQDVAVDLSRLRRAIRGEQRRSTRQFLWVSLAETVRLVSNSRTSTVKLHVRPVEEIQGRQLDVVAIFDRILGRNLIRFREQHDALQKHSLLTRQGHYIGDVSIYLHNVTDGPLPDEQLNRSGMMVTSPPYGDNATTVPYGQHAYLPLQWIDLSDIGDDVDERFLASTHAIDSMSLGAPGRGAMNAIVGVRAASPTLDSTLSSLASQPRDRAVRVAAFWRDFDRSIDHILATLAPGALMGWTVGNRRVGGQQIPMDDILSELLQQRGCELLTSLRRAIPDCRKRMASRNSVTSTMTSERVLVLRHATRQPNG